ncbi:hypothetical protein DQ04_12391000 [Trypanosoma grayi]|uniref:hypothetical protein n=1 Tax=Trypanosoma grayi TaxID=71804 RepID=UPI0004F461DC|nr:hypothetical protein DQ04_12391000 [Trypanosoma grayi]KEG06758.1 hypothetical protein DQ04_12391000 [Trypanosoma grayi]
MRVDVERCPPNALVWLRQVGSGCGFIAVTVEGKLLWFSGMHQASRVGNWRCDLVNPCVTHNAPVFDVGYVSIDNESKLY